MIKREDATSIGIFRKTHALKGELNAVTDIDLPFCEDPIPVIVDMDGIMVPFYVESWRPKGQFSSLIKLEGIDSEEEASEFVNKEIYVLKTDLAEYSDTDENGEYADDLVGYTVTDEKDNRIGTISELDLTTENALFIVKDGDRKIYIPIVDEFIEEIDNGNKIIRMHLPEGLLDMN